MDFAKKMVPVAPTVFWGGQKAKSKLAFGTMKFESAASDFPPEGPKKGSYVEKSTFIKIKN